MCIVVENYMYMYMYSCTPNTLPTPNKSSFVISDNHNCANPRKPEVISTQNIATQ